MQGNVIAIIIAAVLISFIAGYLVRKSIAEAKIASAETQAGKIIEEAQYCHLPRPA